jgi:hypothetical protein
MIFLLKKGDMPLNRADLCKGKLPLRLRRRQAQGLTRFDARWASVILFLQVVY